MVNSTTLNKQSGFSLVEIMISLALGIFITGGMLQLFVNSSQSYRIQESVSRLQENGRFAMDFISKDIRMAGYFGCQNNLGPLENALNDKTNNAWNITPLTGYDNVTGAFSVFSNVLPNTDVIVTQSLSSSSSPLISPFSNSSQMFVGPNFNSDCTSPNQNTCHIGEILMVTDCSQATIFQATNTSTIGAGTGVNVVHSASGSFTPGNESPPTFTNTYQDGSQIAKLNTFGYFIRLNNSNNPSLYRSRLVTTLNTTNALEAEELVEGIENMQILYGVDTTGPNDGSTPNYYAPAGTAGLNMDNVVSVRISLLATTLEDNLATEPLPYSIFDATTTPPAPTLPTDRKIRRVYTTTIAIRNRLL